MTRIFTLVIANESEHPTRKGYRTYSEAASQVFRANYHIKLLSSTSTLENTTIVYRQPAGLTWTAHHSFNEHIVSLVPGRLSGKNICTIRGASSSTPTTSIEEHKDLARIEIRSHNLDTQYCV